MTVQPDLCPTLSETPKTSLLASRSIAAHIVHLLQMTEFWKNLDWPDLIDALPMVRKLTEDVCNGAALYAELVHRKLQQAGYYDEEGQFDVTDKVSAVAKLHGL